MDTKIVLYSHAIGVPLLGAALIMHGAVQPMPCIGQQYVCPEPEQRLDDRGKRDYPRAPSLLYGGQTMAITTGTGTAGNNMLGTYVSTGPQSYQDVQSSVYRSV